MSKCLYCDNDLDNSCEHVLQESLGGSWESTNILCKECNSLFGETIDKKIAEDFRLFRSFLNVLGKRNDVPDCPLETGDGKNVIRKHETGFLKNLVKPEVKKSEDKNGKIVHSFCGPPGQALVFLKGVIDKAKKRGERIGEIRLEEYIATPAPPCRNERALNPETWIAALKAIINFCALANDAAKEKAKPTAEKIREFAYGCRESKDIETPSRLYKGLELGGYPLSIRLSLKAQQILANGRELFNAIFLVPKGDGLYGCICLFNNILWGFKISDDATGIDHPIGCLFDPRLKKHLKSIPEFGSLDSADFSFRQLNDEEWLQYNQKMFNDSLRLCHLEDLRTTILSYLDNKDIAQLASSLKSEDIDQIVIGRIRSLINTIWTGAGLNHIYSEFMLEDLAKDLFASFVKQNKGFVLNGDDYAILMSGVINFSIETLKIWEMLPDAFTETSN